MLSASLCSSPHPVWISPHLPLLSGCPSTAHAAGHGGWHREAEQLSLFSSRLQGRHGALQGMGDRRGGSGTVLEKAIFSPAALLATVHESKGHLHNRANSGQDSDLASR